MLSRTHGQAATPTTFGKEIAVFVHRLTKLLAGSRTNELRGGLGTRHELVDLDWASRLTLPIVEPPNLGLKGETEALVTALRAAGHAPIPFGDPVELTTCVQGALDAASMTRLHAMPGWADWGAGAVELHAPRDRGLPSR
jgi:hypothetical protein